MGDALRLRDEDPTLQELVVFEQALVGPLHLVRSCRRCVSLRRESGELRFELGDAPWRRVGGEVRSCHRETLVHTNRRVVYPTGSHCAHSLASQVCQWSSGARRLGLSRSTPTSSASSSISFSSTCVAPVDGVSRRRKRPASSRL